MVSPFHPRVRTVTWLGQLHMPGALGTTPISFWPVTLVKRWAGAPSTMIVMQPT
jgi:hypothetical protein